MLDTILFDMGGTIEDIWFNEETTLAVADKIIAILAKNGIQTSYNIEDFMEKLFAGVKRYKAWSQSVMLENKPEEIWSEYYLYDFQFPKQKIMEISEELAQTWEKVYYHRVLRPHVKESLDALQERGYKLGIISNTISLYSVFNVLEEYEIREYFQDVTLSSVTGYRKPHTAIFEIALRQNDSKAENCMYVGDTISRDVIGAKRAKFGKVVQIQSFMTEMSDEKVKDDSIVADYIISDMEQIVPYVDKLRAEK